MHTGHTNLVLSNVSSNTPILQYSIVNVFPYQNIKCLTRFSISTVFSLGQHQYAYGFLILALYSAYNMLEIVGSS